jgi:hypothetical protein
MDIFIKQQLYKNKMEKISNVSNINYNYIIIILIIFIIFQIIDFRKILNMEYFNFIQTIVNFIKLMFGFESSSSKDPSDKDPSTKTYQETTTETGK